LVKLLLDTLIVMVEILSFDGIDLFDLFGMLLEPITHLIQAPLQLPSLNTVALQQLTKMLLLLKRARGSRVSLI